MDKETKNEFNNLARMIKTGFDGVDEKFEENKKDHQTIMVRLDNLEKGHEEIKLKLDQVAYRFEFEDLEKRFDERLRKLELKLGLASANP